MLQQVHKRVGSAAWLQASLRAHVFGVGALLHHDAPPCKAALCHHYCTPLVHNCTPLGASSRLGIMHNTTTFLNTHTHMWAHTCTHLQQQQQQQQQQKQQSLQPRSLWRLVSTAYSVLYL